MYEHILAMWVAIAVFWVFYENTSFELRLFAFAYPSEFEFLELFFALNVKCALC